MREYQDCIKRNEGNIHILEKKLKLANDEIAKLKNKNAIKNSDDTMINYYLSVQQAKDNRSKENDSIKLLYNKIEELKKEIDAKNKVNEQLKKEIQNKNNIIFNLPFSFKEQYIPNRMLSPRKAEISGSLAGSKEILSEEKNSKLNSEEENNKENDEKDKNNNVNSIEDDDVFYLGEIRRLKLNQKKNMEIMEQKYKNLISDKNKEFDELKSYINKIIDLHKREIDSYKKEIVKYNELFMQLISNYKRIFFSKLTPQCTIVTLKNKKEEFDNIILNTDKDVNHLNFPLLFKELESKDLLNINVTGNISNMKKAGLKVKKFKNINNINNINEDKKVNEIKSIFKDEVPPPSIQNMKSFVKETTNEGKIIINKEKLNEMSKEALVIHCLNLNKIVNEVEHYLEKYAEYKKGFNVEEFENNITYKEKIINELNNKINKLTIELDEQIQTNYNSMTVIKSQNRVIEKLQKGLLYNNIMKNKHKNFLSTLNSYMNTNMLINENSTCSTLIPSLNNMNNNYLNLGKKLKKSNSCFHMTGNNEVLENHRVVRKRDKQELNNGFISLSSIKSNNYQNKNNEQKNNTTINDNNNIINNKISKNNYKSNRSIRPFSSAKRIFKNEFGKIIN